MEFFVSFTIIWPHRPTNHSKWSSHSFSEDGPICRSIDSEREIELVRWNSSFGDIARGFPCINAQDTHLSPREQKKQESSCGRRRVKRNRIARVWNYSENLVFYYFATTSANFIFCCCCFFHSIKLLVCAAVWIIQGKTFDDCRSKIRRNWITNSQQLVVCVVRVLIRRLTLN